MDFGNISLAHGVLLKELREIRIKCIFVTTMQFLLQWQPSNVW